jgi:peptidoglycan/LPS O-acetylase OafA/YrhL
VQVHENHFYLALPLMAAAGAVLPRMRAPFALASIVCLLNLFLFQGIGRDVPIHTRGLTIVDATVLLSFVNLAALAWHARRFSEQTAGPAAVDLDGHASDV